MSEERAEIARLTAQLSQMKEARQRTADQVASLLRISASLLATRDLTKQLEMVAEGIVSACDYRRCVITLIDNDWKVWKRSHAGLSEAEAQELESVPEISPEVRRSILDENYRLGNSFFVPHDSNLGGQLSDVGVSSSRGREEFIDWHPEDFLFVPLLGKDEKMLGTISIDDPHDGRRPTAASLRVVELFAREAAFAIEQNLLLTELSKTEGYLDNLVTNSADAIVATGPKGKIALWNESATRMLGWQRDEIVGESVLRLYANEEDAKRLMRELMSPDNEEPGRLDGRETILVSKSGEQIPVSVSISALYGSDGEFLGTAGISRDLRPWKKLEAEMLKAEKAATLSEVAATLCHEINNVLEEILSAGQVSLLTFDMPETREMFQAAGKGATLEREIDRLRVISREALRIASLTSRLQEMAQTGEGEYGTTEYVDEIQMMEMPEEGTAGAGARILVADDREYIREFLREFLALEGFEVDVAEDGEIALQMVRREHYDVVLSDIKMPNKNGYEVFRGAREHDPSVKVILMTAYGYDPAHSIVRASKEGLSDVLFKPFQMARVRDAIQKALTSNGGGSE